MKAQRHLLVAIAVVSCSFVLMVPVYAEQIPEPGATDARVRTVRYVAGDVIRLQGFPGYAIHLAFAPGEVFEGLGAGDMEAVSFIAERNHLFLKPKVSRVATNLTLLTNRRVYQLDYRVTGRRPEVAGDELIYSLSFLYPEEAVRELAATAEAHRVTETLSAALPVINHRYGFCGPKSLRPVEASDDGVQTRLKFPPRVDFPAVFVRNEDGTESLVNFTVVGDGIVLHRVAKAFVLRRGKAVGCVVNQQFTGGGASLASGTRSPAIERTTQGGAP